MFRRLHTSHHFVTELSQDHRTHTIHSCSLRESKWGRDVATYDKRFVAKHTANNPEERDEEKPSRRHIAVLGCTAVETGGWSVSQQQ